MRGGTLITPWYCLEKNSLASKSITARSVLTSHYNRWYGYLKEAHDRRALFWALDDGYGSSGNVQDETATEYFQQGSCKAVDTIHDVLEKDENPRVRAEWSRELARSNDQESRCKM